jgi:hypothetical protein
MGNLAVQFPHVRRISAPTESSDDPEQLVTLIEPYREWEMADVDTASTDILIWDPHTPGDQPGERNMVILCGRLPIIWLQHRKS